MGEGGGGRRSGVCMDTERGLFLETSFILETNLNETEPASMHSKCAWHGGQRRGRASPNFLSGLKNVAFDTKIIPFG